MDTLTIYHVKEEEDKVITAVKIVIAECQQDPMAVKCKAPFLGMELKGLAKIAYASPESKVLKRALDKYFWQNRYQFSHTPMVVFFGSKADSQNIN
jgi:hypothetical protein